VAVFWVVAPRSLVDDYRRFRGAYGLYHQGDEFTKLHGATSQKTAIFILISQQDINIYERKEEGKTKKKE
jgi:hypothetical protein